MPGLLEYSASLSPEDEAAFQRDMQFAPGWSDWRRDFIKNFGSEPNTAPGGDYNYRLAWLSGATPEYHEPSNSFHGMSSATIPPYDEPVNFKAEDHPTMWKESFMREYGFDPDDPNAEWTEESTKGLLHYLGVLKYDPLR